MRPTTLLLSLAAMLALPLAAQAQTAPEREGMWLTIGAGAGSARVTCASCREERVGAPSGYLGLGGTISQSVLLGGEMALWIKTDDDLDRLVGALNGVAYLYPDPTRGLYLKGGLGLLRYEVSEEDDPEDTARVTGISLVLGIGYEFAVAPTYAIAPFVNLVASSFGNLKQEGDVLARGVNTTLLQFGLSLTSH